MCHNAPEGSGDEAFNLTCLAKFDLPRGRGASPYGVASFQGSRCVIATDCMTFDGKLLSMVAMYVCRVYLSPENL